MPGTHYTLEVNPRIPPQLTRLSELAENLWYSWDRPTRSLFARLHPALWLTIGQSPKSFLKRIDQHRLDAAAQDPSFLDAYHRVLSALDTYMAKAPRTQARIELPDNTLIAYFCAEFGFHESLPIYSGGLGILAGDHCKAASDLGLPFIAMGLLYRQGYFQQAIDREGRQVAIYHVSNFADLPISPVLTGDGHEMRVVVEFPGRAITLKVWQAIIGHVTLYLLDTDLDVNSEHDRSIGHSLYGGDKTTRIEQEVLLGVGGVRALRALGKNPTAWHINEGHAAFLILERINQLVNQGLDIESAREAVAANTVFTTHTAVPAGHDHFPQSTVAGYLKSFAPALDIACEDFLNMGRSQTSADFNMTALSIRGSRFHNGVSRIHGNVSADMLSSLWPQIEAGDNPVDYITNGVHVQTFLAVDWYELFDRHLGESWRQTLTDTACWEKVHSIPDPMFWAIRQSLKSQMLALVRHRIEEQSFRNQNSESHVDRILRLANPEHPNVLTIGFARRFATYKRAALLFSDLDWLREIITQSDRPVLFIFAGKAHPADIPGQELIRRISEIARMPEFIGHILLVENYDLNLARSLVAGVDVWLNNPVYPLEASGTSGMKAGMNGVVNLSVLDGWWDESYDGKNGWAIKPASDILSNAERDREESNTLYELLQDSVIPLYYSIGPMGFSPGWVATAKRSMASILPRFNTDRMVSEYVEKFYIRAHRQWERFAQNDFSGARDFAQWKTHIRNNWQQTAIRRLSDGQNRIGFGDSLLVEVAVNLGELAPENVTVELLLTRPSVPDVNTDAHGKRYALVCAERMESGEYRYTIELKPELCGRLEYRIRVYPYHPLLTHPFETGMMRWL